MTPRQAERLRQAIAILKAKQARESPRGFIPHAPHAKQQAFLSLDCMEALYGGAAGGGKSDALLMAALQYVHVPGYAALILRRTFQDLLRSDAIMARADTWLRGTAAKWKAETRTWHFPSGATLSFGYFDTQRDRDAYQGGAWQFVAFDETTQFPEAWYLYLFSRLRKPTDMPVPLRMRSASNPGGLGHEWVYRRFVNPGATDRPFIPARLEDNPYVDGVSYREALEKLDEVTRRQLLEGVWVRDAGGLVYRYNQDRNSIAKAPPLDHHVVGIDYGFTDATAFCVIGWRANDPCVYVVEGYKRTGLTPSDAAEEAHALSAKYKPVQMVGDVGGLGKGYAEEARKRFTLPIEPASKNDKRGYQALFNGDLERGRIKVVGCPDLVAEWLELPWTEDHAKEAEGFDNHCADACLYAWRSANAFHEAPPPPAPTADERLRAEEAAMLEQLQDEVQREADGDWWAR